MKLLDPRLWLGAVSFGAVIALLVADLEHTSPGPLTATHALDERLDSPDGCVLCHGDTDQTMLAACGSCHASITDQIEAATGFHGDLDPAAARACEGCHLEHHGRTFELTGERSFTLAGFESRDAYDHRGLDFALEGRHDDLACRECHSLADVQLLHEGDARFLGLDPSCTTCHDDPHEGQIVRACEECHAQEGEFQMRSDYEHGDAFALEGAHALVGCLDCHSRGGSHSVEVLAGAGAMPPGRDCGACHESPHRSTFLEGVVFLAAIAAGTEQQSAGGSCALCHSAEHESFDDSRVTVDPQRHAATGFPLVAPHAELACAECHASADPAHDYAEVYPGRSADECAQCHEDPHGGQFAGGPFSAAGCLECHDRHAFTPPAFGLAEHDRTAFPLIESHSAVGCFACHKDPVDQGKAGEPRAFRGTASECAACHVDAHDGKFQESAPDCATCHAPTRFTEVADFDHGEWAAFTLEGAHGRADCEACHARTGEADAAGRTFGRVERVFGQPTRECATCHADAHWGVFEATGILDGDQGCAKCHTTDSFDELHGEFDHARSTGFPLEGAHGRADCEVCHPRTTRPDAYGRTFGRAAEHFGTPADRCDTCHADAHGGMFETLGLPTEFSGAESCARCHSSESFREVAVFDHALWTGYSLESAHAEASCEACHTPTPLPDARGRSLGHAAGRRCTDCHENPHAGQFAEAGRTDCARCHSVAPSFADLAFDHGRDSRFALDEKHDDLACSACHIPWPLPGGGEAVRYKPLGIECGDCHGDKR